jgi:hypothetical protein
MAEDLKDFMANRLKPGCQASRSAVYLAASQHWLHVFPAAVGCCKSTQSARQRGWAHAVFSSPETGKKALSQCRSYTHGEQLCCNNAQMVKVFCDSSPRRKDAARLLTAPADKASKWPAIMLEVNPSRACGLNKASSSESARFSVSSETVASWVQHCRRGKPTRSPQN